MADTQTKFMSGTDANDKGNGFPENFVNKLFIDTKPTVDSTGDVDLDDVTTGSWAWIGSGITAMTPSANETSTNEAYYDGGGFTETDVTGKQIQLALSGNRKVGDPAQDYIDNLFWKFGNALKTRAIWIKNGIPVITKCTITSVVPSGGNANSKQTFSFNVAFNGRPKIFNGQLTMSATAQPKIYGAKVNTEQQPSGGAESMPAIINETVSGTVSGLGH